MRRPQFHRTPPIFTPMKKLLSTLCLLAAISPALTADELLDRGTYLVEKVGMCQDCHSPRDQTGQYIKAQWMAGNTLPFKPTVPMPVWAPTAPDLRNLPNYTDEQAMKMLTEGITRLGTPARPPMPEFRFNEEDAKAVIAYFRNLKPAEEKK